MALQNIWNYSAQQHQGLLMFSPYSCRSTAFHHLQEKKSSIVSFFSQSLEHWALSLKDLPSSSGRHLMLYTGWKIRTTKITITARPLGLQSNKTYCTWDLPADITTGCSCDECKEWFKEVVLYSLLWGRRILEQLSHPAEKERCRDEKGKERTKEKEQQRDKPTVGQMVTANPKSLLTPQCLSHTQSICSLVRCTGITPSAHFRSLWLA